MSVELEKPIAFDESCAQEQLLPARASAGLRQPGATGADRLSRLDWLFWVLCFGLGTLFGHEHWPWIEATLSRF